MVRQKNIKLVIEYDGAAYAGWQYQPKQRTVQGELETALKKLTRQTVTLYGAGRTDAGVSALGQVANFRIAHPLPVAKYRDGLNFYLPDDILVRRAEEAPLSFHARHDAAYRQYRYTVGLARSARDRGRRWEISRPLDIKLLNGIADYILGEHDFTACCVVSSQKVDNRCVVYASRWKHRAAELCYDISADRFLHTMVRSLVGLMVSVGAGDLTVREFRRVFHSGDHTAVTKVAPARGLCLVAVGY